MRRFHVVIWELTVGTKRSTYNPTPSRGEDKLIGGGCSHHLHIREQRMLVLGWLFFFMQSGIPFHTLVLPTFQVGLPSSLNLIQKFLHRYPLKTCFPGDPSSWKLMIKINHHDFLLGLSGTWPFSCGLPWQHAAWAPIWMGHHLTDQDTKEDVHGHTPSSNCSVLGVTRSPMHLWFP